MPKTKKRSSNTFKLLLMISAILVGSWYIFKNYLVTPSTISINEISPTGVVSLSLSPATVSINPNTTTKISVVVDSGTTPLAAIKLKLNFDSTKLTVTNLVKGTWLPTALVAPIIGTGSITAELAAPEGAARIGSGTLFTFDVKGAASGTYPITFDLPYSEAGISTEGQTDINNLKSATGTSITINSAPTITTQPIAAQTVTTGANVSLSVAGTGVPAPTFQWYNGATALPGKTSQTLSLTSVQLADAGDYTVKLTNSVGTTTSTISKLIVNSPIVAPSITTQPTSTPIVTEKSSITLSVIATGTAPLSYQWYKGTTALTGKTSSTLLISDAKTSLSPTPDAGVYTVKITNSAGSVTSSTSTLSVKPKADITGTTRIVDNFDFIAFLQNYNTPGSIADLNGSGTPDIYDFTKLISQYGLSW